MIIKVGDILYAPITDTKFVVHSIHNGIYLRFYNSRDTFYVNRNQLEGLVHAWEYEFEKQLKELLNVS
jgi:hypothetical protein